MDEDIKSRSLFRSNFAKYDRVDKCQHACDYVNSCSWDQLVPVSLSFDMYVTFKDVFFTAGYDKSSLQNKFNEGHECLILCIDKKISSLAVQEYQSAPTA